MYALNIFYFILVKLYKFYNFNLILSSVVIIKCINFLLVKIVN